jgi:inner membrane protein
MAWWQQWLASPWVWIVVGLVVAALEVVRPGRLAVWLGMAIIAVGLVLLVLPGISLAMQLGLFAVLAGAMLTYGARVERERILQDHDEE